MLRPITICFTFPVLATTAEADTIHFYSGESIQAAISGADSGDEIIVHPVTYTATSHRPHQTREVIT